MCLEYCVCLALVCMYVCVYIIYTFVCFYRFSNAPLEEVNPKKKILERLFPDLKTSADGTPTYQGVPFMTSKGPVTSTLPNGTVG